MIKKVKNRRGIFSPPFIGTYGWRTAKTHRNIKTFNFLRQDIIIEGTYYKYTDGIYRSINYLLDQYFNRIIPSRRIKFNVKFY